MATKSTPTINDASTKPMVCKSLTLKGTSTFSNLNVWVLKKYFIFFISCDYLPAKNPIKTLKCLPLETFRNVTKIAF